MSERIHHFAVGKLIIIESLGHNDYQSGYLLHKRLIEHESILPEIVYKPIKRRNDLFVLLEQIRLDALSGNGNPILHFVLHGDDQGLLLASNDFVEWAELSDRIRAINIATRNNLFITMSSCFGFYGAYMQGLEHPNRSSFWCLLGRTDKYAGGDFTNDYFRFYKTFGETSDFGKALRLINGTGKDYSLYFCEHMFMNVIGRFTTDHSFFQDLSKTTALSLQGFRHSGKPLPTTVERYPEFLYDVFLHKWLNWHETFFMTDLYPENEARFLYKDDIRKVLDDTFKRRFLEAARQ